MDFLNDVFQNTIFVSAALGWLIAQVLKTLIYLIINKRFVAERMVGGAGMKYGGGSFEFAISAMFAIVVMYDAMGVRRETGIQAKVLNEMMDLLTNMGKEMSAEDRLKELVGHTPLQVLMGALLGVLIAVLIGM